jgi:hypothetical protein
MATLLWELYIWRHKSVPVFKCLPKKEFLYLASRMTLLSNAISLRGATCTIVKITVKEFTPFVMFAID